MLARNWKKGSISRDEKESGNESRIDGSDSPRRSESDSFRARATFSMFLRATLRSPRSIPPIYVRSSPHRSANASCDTPSRCATDELVFRSERECRPFTLALHIQTSPFMCPRTISIIRITRCCMDPKKAFGGLILILALLWVIGRIVSPPSRAADTGTSGRLFQPKRPSG